MKEYLTPRNFLICCGVEKSKCTEVTIGAYLGEEFLNLQVYREGSTFDSYFISQTENTSSRFFMNPTGKSRRSVSQDKCVDIYNGLTEAVIRSVAETVEERLRNPVYEHPDLETILAVMRSRDWIIDQEAEADLITAGDMDESVGIMILLFASIFQDYYSVTGISRRVRMFLNAAYRYGEQDPQTGTLRESRTRLITPVSGRRTDQTYIRREGLLMQIGKRMRLMEEQGEKQFLILSGEAGSGKSELARAYAGENTGHGCRRVIWLNCQSGKEQTGLEELCRAAEGELSGRKLAAQLSEADSGTLLVVDDYNHEISSLVNEIYCHTGDASVLLLSRMSMSSGFDEKNTLQMMREDQAEFCFQIFRKNYERRGSARSCILKEEDGEAAKKICEAAHQNPLFIAMTANFLREHESRISIEQFSRNLNRGIIESFPKYSQLYLRKDDRERRHLQPQEALKALYREELQYLNCLKEEERQMLNLLFSFRGKPESVTLVCELLGDNSGQLLMETVLNRLVRYSILRRDRDRISIPPMLWELIRSGAAADGNIPLLYSEEEKDAFFTHALEHMFLFEESVMQNFSDAAERIYSEISEPGAALKLVYGYFFSGTGEGFPGK